VLKCGAAYVPFDWRWPERRLEDVFGMARCAGLLSDRTEQIPTTTDRWVVRVDDASLVPSESGPGAVVDPAALAYVNFTSGSTGRPKAVPIQHRSIARLVFGAAYARLDAGSTLLQLAPVHFDAATFEIWGALLQGGTCVLYPGPHLRLSELGQILRANRVTVLFLTTVLFNTIVDECPNVLASLETVLTGGEAHSLGHMRRAVELYGPERVVSVYGPTECTTFATYYPVRVVDGGHAAFPIGRPIQNTRAYVVAGGRLCEPGETGELLVAGPGLSPGYLGMPELTAQRFVHHEIGVRTERLYCTGDLVYLSDGGDLVFMGREDDQVKVNGFRVELSEISFHLDQSEDVQQSYVAVDQTASSEKVLVAFVVPASERCTVDSVRAHLRARLPAYMLPAAIHLRPRLPLTATGKVDKQLLLAGTGVEPGALR
jgi:D-alanine--poly(phosphoribitol) ligase subunit 1